MASKGAKAALMDTSVKRLQANIDKLSKSMGVDPLEIPTYNRDPELLMAYQLEAAANWTDALVKQSEPAKKEQAVKPAEDADRATEDSSAQDETQDIGTKTESKAPTKKGKP